VLFWSILALGTALRLALYSGYGLGDDPNFTSAFFRLARAGTYDPGDPYDVRFGMWIPIVWFIRVVGYREIGVIGPITVCSILNLPLVYAIARLEWDATAALVAMALLAVFPLDVLCSTLFAPDVMLATYAFGAFWLYAVALRDEARPALRHAAAAGSAVLFLAGFASKPWVFFVGAMMVLDTLPRLRTSWRWALLTAGETTFLVALFCAWQWWSFGDPLHYVTIAKAFANLVPYDRDVVLDYPRMLFLPNDYGAYFAGWYPHTLVLLAVLFALRLVRAGKWLVYFAIVVAGLSAMPAGRVHGVWVTFVPHIFRYLTIASLPLCLALTAYVRELVAWRSRIGWSFLAAFLALGVVQAWQVTFPTRDAFGEERRAVALAHERFPDERIISDAHLASYYSFFYPEAFGRDRTIPILSERSAGRAKEFRKLTEGVLVTGGGRLPWYTCLPCHCFLDGIRPPKHWRLVATFDGAPRMPYRPEPLRIWRVSKAAEKADRLWVKHPARAARVAIVRALAEGRHAAVAAEIGQRLLAEGAGSADLAYWTGIACAQAARPSCATTQLAASLEQGLSPARARPVLVRLGMDATNRGDFRAARRWAAEYRRRFPKEPLDPQLAAAESGFGEAQYRFARGEYPTSRRMFEAIVVDPQTPPDYVRQARYYLAFIAFQERRVGAGLAYADAYRAAYGEDPFWIELQFRHAQALRWSDTAAARAAFADIEKRYAHTPWANEARRELTELARLGRS